jgi:catechol 2,3-dioxygenase-like lactoylglutathione lyase family enzyme
MAQLSRILVGVVLSSLLITGAMAQQPVPRPAISGIASVQIYVTNPAAARDFYEKTLRIPAAKSGCDTHFIACLALNNHQQVQLLSAPSPVPTNLIAKVTLATVDVAQMRRYLVSKGLAPDASHDQGFDIKDPEGHVISFVQAIGSRPSVKASGQSSARLIHAGFIVKDRQAEDRFYKDILGFHLYWQGGMKDGETNWVSLQVPDGTDWLEYMLNVPSEASHHTIGVMNHIALGVADIKDVREQLVRNGWKPSEEPKLGRDGKRQLNLYDPDETRVEFMEFKPVEKPCCSEFTGQHPAP